MYIHTYVRRKQVYIMKLYLSSLQCLFYKNGHHTVIYREHKHLRMNLLKSSKLRMLNCPLPEIKVKNKWIAFNETWTRSLLIVASLKVNALNYKESIQ